MIRDRGVEKVEEYIYHRSQREEQVLASLIGNYALSSWDIMKLVYKDSIGNMSFIIKLSAQNSTIHHLEKLEVEKKVQKKWPDMWCLNK